MDERTEVKGILAMMVMLTVVLGATTHAAFLAPLTIAIGCILYLIGYEEVADPFTDTKPLTDVRERYVNGEIDEQEFERIVENELEHK